MAHVCGDVIKMQGRNSLNSLLHSFPYWVTIGGWSCVEGQGSMCAGVSKITCHHYWRPVGKQMSHTMCLASRKIHLKGKDKYRRSVSRNTVNKSAGVNRVRVAADCRPSVHLPPLESWAGGDSWSEPLWYNIHCNTRAFFRTLYLCLSCTIFLVLFLYVRD